MALELFGFEIQRKKEEKQQERLESFAPPSNDDGSLIVAEGGVYGTYVDLDGSVRTEAELVNKYRTMALDPIVDLAIQDIINDSIVEDADEDTISLSLDDLKIPDSIKKKIQEEFKEVLRLLEFTNLSYEIFRRWYIDGRLYYHIMIDEKKPKDGIKELRYIDPRHIKKIREVKRERKGEVELERIVGEYYLFNKSGFARTGPQGQQVTSPHAGGTSAQGIKIAKDSILYCTSGYMSADNNLIYSYLHKAIRPLNQLRSMEDSLVIYRISRAPERRIFYVDVGGLPKAKAEQYLRDIMTKFKNKTVYDSSTGEIRNDRKFMTMLEDFWLPRRDGSRGTEITTLPGGQNLGEIEDIVYFQNLLYRSLNVPSTRLNPETTFTLGRATEITRDEVKFSKFIGRLRNKFSQLFTKLLERQLLLKGICTVDDWREWVNDIHYEFAIDNYFAELKEMEMTRDRITLLRDMDEYVGKYYSHEYIRRFVLHQSEEAIKEIDKQIEEEQKSPKYADHDEEEFGLQTKAEPREEPEEKPEPKPEPDPPREKPKPEEEKEKKNDLKQEQLNHDLCRAQLHLFESMQSILEED